VRRSGPCFLELVERPWLDLAALLQGALVPARAPFVQAWAPPRAEPVALEPATAAVLASLAQGGWSRSADHPAAAVAELLALGLVCGSEAEPGDAPAAAPLADWFGPAALYHYASRWSEVVARDDLPADAAAAARAADDSERAFAHEADVRGAPPAARHARGDASRAVPLPPPPQQPLDAWLARRETHRLFDPAQPVGLDALSRLLHRSLGVLGAAPLGGGHVALRKHAPSGGGLHPVEGYVLAANVAGLAPGWYHYHAQDHRLAPLAALEREAAGARIVALTAGQRYFRDAALLVALTLRFPRHHWKYPRHAKAYRVMLIDAGHVAQLFALACTEEALGPFVTAAINEAELDAELGLDGVAEGAVVLLGCGVPAPDGAVLRLSHYVRDAG
jgi:putative peptide maturation dehydrogenase